MDTRISKMNTMKYFKEDLFKNEFDKYINPVAEIKKIEEAVNVKHIPLKYARRVESGRWEYIEKVSDGILWVIGIRRKSTGEERWFDRVNIK